MTAAPQLRSLVVGDVRLAVREYGDAARPPLLALHGFPEMGRTWESMVDPIVASGRRIVAPDLRGYGQSDAPPKVSAYRMERLLDDVEGIITDLGVAEIDMIGHDWGGALVWLMAERRPSRLRRAIMINIPHPAVLRRAVLHERAQRKRSSYIVKFQIPLLPERRLVRDDGALLASLFPVGQFDADILNEYRACWTRPGVMRGMLNWYRAAARDRSLRVPDAAIDVPVTLIWGRADPVFEPGLLERSAALCSDVSVRAIEECGHAPHREQPGVVAGMVLAALA